MKIDHKIWGAVSVRQSEMRSWRRFQRVQEPKHHPRQIFTVTQACLKDTIIPTHQSRFSGFDDKIISMDALLIIARDIQDHLQEIYGAEVSVDLFQWYPADDQ